MAHADVVDSLFSVVHAMPEAKYGKPCNFCWHPNIIYVSFMTFHFRAILETYRQPVLSKNP